MLCISNALPAYLLFSACLTKVKQKLDTPKLVSVAQWQRLFLCL